MSPKTIIVPVTGASNIKLEVFDFEKLECFYSLSTSTPSRHINNLEYNAPGEEFAWFDNTIRALPEHLKSCNVIAPVAKGASGGLVGHDNTLIEEPGEDVTLSYAQRFPEAVEDRFRKLAGNSAEFFLETGSIRDFPGSLTLVKRFIFEEMERPELLKKTAGFGTYGALMSGHFLGGNYLSAIKKAGNENSYWMCHSGARNIHESTGAPSRIAARLSSFSRLIPRQTSVVYKPLGFMPPDKASLLGLSGFAAVIPGGHDTCLSHIPVLSTFYQAFPEGAGNSVIQVEAGTWTLVAKIGGNAELPPDGWRHDIIVQGTVDGEPVITARYGGGNDFRYMKERAEAKGTGFTEGADDGLLAKMAEAADCFVLPNISPLNYGTGPFPDVKGKMINSEFMFRVRGAAYMATTLTTALAASIQVKAISSDPEIPIVITAGGGKDPFYGKLLATFTGQRVYALVDRNGNPVTETTSLGAAIAGKAAILGIHPYHVDTSGLELSYREIEPYVGDMKRRLALYSERWTNSLAE